MANEKDFAEVAVSEKDLGTESFLPDDIAKLIKQGNEEEPAESPKSPTPLGDYDGETLGIG